MRRFSGAAGGAHAPTNTAPTPEHAPASEPGPRVTSGHEVPGQAREAVHFTPVSAQTPTNTAPTPEHAPASEPGPCATLTRSRCKPGTGERRR